MQSRDFCFWLQGFFELSEASDRITADQVSLIRRHLDLVFAHEPRLLEHFWNEVTRAGFPKLA
jgi:hypothetical protein